MTAIRRPRRFTLVPTNGRLRRISLVAGRPGEGPLTEPIAATQPRRQEPLFMPHKRHSWPHERIVGLPRKRSFAPDWWTCRQATQLLESGINTVAYNASGDARLWRRLAVKNPADSHPATGRGFSTSN